MNKVLYNTCFGGFGISDKALNLYCEEVGVGLEGMDEMAIYNFKKSIERHDPALIKVFEKLGSESFSGSCAKIDVDISEASCYEIREYDGKEVVRWEHDLIVIK